MNWFYNMKISTKLLIGFLIVTLIAGGIGSIGILNIQKLSYLDTELYEKMTQPLSELIVIVESYQKMRGDLKDAILSKNVSEINEYEKRIADRNNEFSTKLNDFKKTLLTQEGQEVVQKLEDLKVRYDEIASRVVRLAKDNRDEEAIVLLLEEGDNVRKELETELEKVSNEKVRLAKETSDGNTNAANAATASMTILLVLGMGISVLLGMYISASINKPIKTIMEAANRIAEGNLDVMIDIRSKDEIGTLAETFRVMADNINEVMSNISISAGQVATGSRQVSDSSQGLSQGATEQASSIEELTSSITEIASQTKQNAGNANQANELAQKAKENAEQGNVHMKEMLKSMEQINDSSSNISKIIKVIDEIAFQTNILALNAAVEAARAGQHGKGFAVVAEEVRNLAARSANAAKETTALIEGSIKKVEAGTKTANETANALDEIVKDVSKVTGLVAEIAASSNEQATGIAQINKGIEQVSEVVQVNSATAEESAAASEELSSQADLLKEMVQRFKLKNTQSYHKKMVISESNVGEGSKNPPSDIESYHDSFFSSSRSEAAVTVNRSKIALSDKEFGKY